MIPDGSRWLQMVPDSWAGLAGWAGQAGLAGWACWAGLGWSGLAGLTGWAGLAGLAGLGWLGWPGWFCESSKFIVKTTACESHVSKSICFAMV